MFINIRLSRAHSKSCYCTSKKQTLLSQWLSKATQWFMRVFFFTITCVTYFIGCYSTDCSFRQDCNPFCVSETGLIKFQLKLRAVRTRWINQEFTLLIVELANLGISVHRRSLHWSQNFVLKSKKRQAWKLECYSDTISMSITHLFSAI